MKENVEKIKSILNELQRIKRSFLKEKKNKQGTMINKAINLLENVKRAEINQLQNEKRLKDVEQHYINLEKNFEEALEKKDIYKAQSCLSRLPYERKMKLAPKLMKLMGDK